MFERLFHQPTSVDSSDGSAIGQVIDISGEVMVNRPDDSSQLLSLGDELYANDQVLTQNSSSITIEFANQSEIVLEENAILTLDELVYHQANDDLSMDVSVDLGAFIFSSGQEHSSESHDVNLHTPVATIGIRGTVFACQTGSSLDCTIIQDVIEVSNDFGTYTLDSPGETITATADTAPSFKVMLSMDDLIDYYDIDQPASFELFQSLKSSSEYISDSQCSTCSMSLKLIGNWFF